LGRTSGLSLTGKAQTVSTTSEYRVRRLARRNGYFLRKSRARISLDNEGEYMLVETSRNIVIRGSRFDASLEEIEAFLADDD